jgi:hypothetical protein
MPNGCCMTHCDSTGHDLDCSFYWPCGCKKAKDALGRPKKHVHTYTYAGPSPEERRYDYGDDDD